MSVIVENNTITLTGTVGDIYWSEPSFSAAEVSLALAQVGHDRDVIVRVNSDGGYASEGAAIHAALARHAGKVTVVVEGIAASAASLIVMAGEDIVMAPGSILMIHDPATCTCGTAADHETSIRYLTALATSFAGIYAARSGRSVEQARADMTAEVWFSPEEAVAAGYANRVGNDPDGGDGAVIIEFPDREPDFAAITMLRRSPQMFRNAPEPLRALAVAGRPTKGQPVQAASAAAPSRQETIMTNTPTGGAPATPSPTPAPSAIASANNVVDIDTARVTARTEALAYARTVTELCQLAGLPDRATAFIEADTSVDEVRRQLIDAKAANPATASTMNPTPPAKPARFSLADNMRGRFSRKEG